MKAIHEGKRKHYTIGDGRDLAPYRVPEWDGWTKGFGAVSVHFAAKARPQNLDTTAEGNLECLVG